MLAASYEAKARGVRTAMGGAQARRLCPDAVVVIRGSSAYSEASKAVFEVFEGHAPVVEALSIDEAFLDVRGLEHISGTPREIAARLRRDVREQVGLPITVGVARTKFLAKVASGVAKPDGLLVVPPDGELEFLHPLPVERLWGVGKVTAAQAARARASRPSAQVARGARRTELGRDARPRVRPQAPRARAQPRPAAGAGAAAAALDRRPARARARAARRPTRSTRCWSALVDRVARRLRAARRVCRTVVLRLRFDDFSRATRSHTMGRGDRRRPPTILATARGLLAAAMPLIERARDHADRRLAHEPRRRLAVQLALPVDGRRPGALDATVDDVRERFGTEAITRGGAASGATTGSPCRCCRTRAYEC